MASMRLINGEGAVVSEWKNKIQASLANITSADILAEQHRRMAAPGRGAHQS